jgi:hypothetical protein
MNQLRSRHTTVLFFALALIVASGPVAFSAAGKFETIGAYSGAGPDWVKAALEPQGYRVSLSDGTVANDVWLRNSPASRRARCSG